VDPVDDRVRLAAHGPRGLGHGRRQALASRQWEWLAPETGRRVRVKIKEFLLRLLFA